MTNYNLSSDPQVDRIVAKINKGQSISKEERDFLVAQKAFLERRATPGGERPIQAIADALEKNATPTEPVDGVSALDQLDGEERALAILAAREIIAKRGQH